MSLPYRCKMSLVTGLMSMDECSMRCQFFCDKIYQSKTVSFPKNCVLPVYVRPTFQEITQAFTGEKEPKLPTWDWISSDYTFRTNTIRCSCDTLGYYLAIYFFLLPLPYREAVTCRERRNLLWNRRRYFSLDDQCDQWSADERRTSTEHAVLLM